MYTGRIKYSMYTGRIKYSMYTGRIKYSMTIIFNFLTNCSRRDFEEFNWLAHLILNITGRKELYDVDIFIKKDSVNTGFFVLRKNLWFT